MSRIFGAYIFIYTWADTLNPHNDKILIIIKNFVPQKQKHQHPAYTIKNSWKNFKSSSSLKKEEKVPPEKNICTFAANLRTKGQTTEFHARLC